MGILRKNRSFILIPTAPFHFDGTFHQPSHFPAGMDDWQPGIYWQTIRIGSKPIGLRIEDCGRRRSPRLKVTTFCNRRLDHGQVRRLGQEISWRFDLDADLREFNRRAARDRRFAPVFRRWLGMRVSNAYDLYGLLVVGVVLQNATVRRTVQMMKSLLEGFATRLRFDGKELFAMWLPTDLERVSEQQLRVLRIGYRAKFIKRLSTDFADGMIDECRLRSMGRGDARAELMKLYGVGPETARILMFGALHDYGAFDHVAPWQQKIYSRLFYNRVTVSAKRIRDDIRAQYGDYAMLAVHYIWEDIFWKRKTEHIPWLEKEIRR